MGFFSDLGHAFAGAFTETVLVGRAIVRATPPAIASFMKSAKQLVDEVVNRTSRGIRAAQDDPKTERERIERDLQNVNERIQRLRKKHQSSGGLNAQDDRSWRRWKLQRDALNEQLASIDQVTAAQNAVENEKDLASVSVNDDSAHIIQYHVGQNTHNKTCPCGRAMVLQWRRGLTTASVKDFFGLAPVGISKSTAAVLATGKSCYHQMTYCCLRI